MTILSLFSAARMILAVVKAAALQFFRTVLPIIIAGPGMAIILMRFPPFPFPPFPVVLFPRMAAVPVVPFAVLVIPVVPMLAVTPGLLPFHAASSAESGRCASCFPALPGLSASPLAHRHEIVTITPYIQRIALSEEVFGT